MHQKKNTMNDDDASSSSSSSSSEESSSRRMNEDEDEDDDEEDFVPPTISHQEHKEYGNLAYKRKDYRTAIAHYTRAIETMQEIQQQRGVASSCGDSFVEVGHDDDDDNKKNEEDNTIVATYLNNRAAASTMILQYEDAVDDCTEALRYVPSFVKAALRKAKAQIALGALAEAMTTLNHCSIHDANNAVIIGLKKEVKTLQQRVELTLQLVHTDNSNTTATTKMTTYVPFPLPSTRDARQALKQINMIETSCPAWRGTLLLHKLKALIAMPDQRKEAYALSTSLIRSQSHQDNNNKHDQDDDILLLYRAYALQQLGNIEDASKHLKQILGGDPDNKIAFGYHKVLKSLTKKKLEADTYYKARDYTEAARVYTEALTLPGCDGVYRAKVFFNRACAYANTRKDHEKVIQDCTDAIVLDPQYVKAILRRANSYLVVGEEESCHKALRDFETVYRLAETSGNEAQQKEMKQKLREAKVALKRSKQKDLYKILGVARDATENEIKKGYRKSALKWVRVTFFCSWMLSL